jgi:hypothetical protein
VPGASGTQCIDVTYSGDVAAAVKFYAQYRTAAALAPYLDVTVDQIALGAPCDSSATSSANLHGGLSGAPLNGLVDAHSAYGSGLGTWTPSSTETRRYRVTYVLRDDNAAQGLSTQVGLVWEARNT